MHLKFSAVEGILSLASFDCEMNKQVFSVIM